MAMGFKFVQPDRDAANNRSSIFAWRTGLKLVDSPATRPQAVTVLIPFDSAMMSDLPVPD
jgi:hypothetical protein